MNCPSHLFFVCGGGSLFKHKVEAVWSFKPLKGKKSVSSHKHTSSFPTARSSREFYSELLVYTWGSRTHKATFIVTSSWMPFYRLKRYNHQRKDGRMSKTLVGLTCGFHSGETKGKIFLSDLC